jgi:hypothetical protein
MLDRRDEAARSASVVPDGASDEAARKLFSVVVVAGALLLWGPSVPAAPLIWALIPFLRLPKRPGAIGTPESHALGTGMLAVGRSVGTLEDLEANPDCPRRSPAALGLTPTCAKVPLSISAPELRSEPTA